MQTTRPRGIGRVEYAPQRVQHAGVGGDRGADIRPDRRGIDKMHLFDAGGIDAAHMFRQRLTCRMPFKRGNQAFQYHGRFSGTRHSGHGGEPADRDAHVKRRDGMDRGCRHGDGTEGEHIAFRCALPWMHRTRAVEESADAGFRSCGDLGDSALRDDQPAGVSGPRAYLDDVVGLAQDPRIMVHYDHGIAVGQQIVDHAEQTVDIRRMQANRWLVEHIQHAGGTVAHRTRKLDALAFTGGQGRAGPVQ